MAALFKEDDSLTLRVNVVSAVVDCRVRIINTILAELGRGSGAVVFNKLFGVFLAQCVAECIGFSMGRAS